MPKIGTPWTLLTGLVPHSKVATHPLEEALAQKAPDSSPERLDHQKIACSDYEHAREHYRENERRGGMPERERRYAQDVERKTQACAQ